MLRLTLIACLAAASLAADLPVTTVVLYKHGVGYFERSGTLGPGESARLDFKASEMNDVLKSLTLQSTGDGQFAALRYDASESMSDQLGKFPIRLDPQQPLVHLLDQLKGERLELSYASESVAGSIVGARLIPGTTERPGSEEVTILLDSGEIVNRSLTGAAVRFSDPALQLQIKDYLRVLANARSREKRSVYIDSTDSGRRDVRASYMIPAPVWKSSYRLIMPEGGNPALEGWAIVDNTTGDDWQNVNLALVSGRPVSFVSRLYEPRHVERPVAELPEDRLGKPQIHEAAGLGGARPPEPPAPAAPARRLMMGSAAERFTASADEIRTEKVPVEPSAVAVDTVARELGELFEYSFSSPVTVRKNQSAMLPFLQQEISARKLLIYADHSSAHPMNAAELTNSTGKTLDGGPVTVFEDGSYAGEALMETLKDGDKRLVSYGVDLGARITTAFDSDRSNVREIHMRRGVLTAKSSVREKRTYTIRNVDPKPKTLVIEHPAREGFDLVNREADEKTTNAYRFELDLRPGAIEEFPVIEERELFTRLSVTNLTPDWLISHIENREISDDARRRLQQLLDSKRALAALDLQLQDTEQQRQTLAEDQDRLRKNIGSLNRVAGQQEQVQKYGAQLAVQEGRMVELRDRLQELRNQRTEAQNALDRLIETMEF